MLDRPTTDNTTSMLARAGWLGLLACALLPLVGCGTTSTHKVTEQLLVSSAVDEAVSELSFDDLAGETVFLDASYVQPIEGMGFVNASYIISALRQQLSAAGCLIQQSRDEADIIIEPRVGAMGTEGQMVTFGIPQSNEVSAAAAIFANAPLIPTIPEIALGKSDTQRGAAKIAIFAYERESREPVWQSGTRVAHSSSKRTWLLGAGPLQRGTIHDGIRFAGMRIGIPGITHHKNDEFDAPPIPYHNEVHFVPLISPTDDSVDGPILLTSGEEGVDETAETEETSDE